MKRLSKHKSIGIATLKTLGTQYTMYSDMLRQVSSLYSDFDSELNQALSLVHQRNLQVKEKNDQSIPAGSDISVPKEAQDQESNDESSRATDNNISTELEDDLSSAPWLRKLFKKIAIHCHPDKVLPSSLGIVEKHQRMASYDKARIALDDQNEPLMISVGLVYDEVAEIGIAESKKILAAGVKALESDLNSKQAGLVWSWGMSEDNFDIKAKILIHASAQFYNIQLSVDEALKIVKEFFEIYEPKRNKGRRIGQHPGSRLQSIRNNRK